MYQHPTYTTFMRDYTGRLEYVAFSLNTTSSAPAVGRPHTVEITVSETIKFPSSFVRKPPHRAPKTKYDTASRKISFSLGEPTYQLLQFNDTRAPLGGLLAILAEAKPSPPESDPGVVSIAKWGVKPSISPGQQGGQGDAIQKAINEVLNSSSPWHTLVFPVGTYLTHDLQVSNHSSTKAINILITCASAGSPSRRGRRSR